MVNKNPKVAIIMSTYNGEKYLGQQLESILQQTYRNIDIFVRDDGSTDGTLAILYKYANKNKNIYIEQGGNLGFAPSFLKALSGVKGYDYYAFCDQDDVWLDFKIQRAVEKLEKYPNDQPLLYGSSYDYYDMGLNFCEHAKHPKRIGSFIGSLSEGLTIGTCMVINSATRELILRADPDKIYAHDCFTNMACSALGKIIYDSKPTIKYRRTGNNASPQGYSFFKLQVYRVKNFLIGLDIQRINQQNQHFIEVFYDELSPEDQKIADLFRGKNTASKQIRKVFYPERWRSSLFDEASLRFLFLIGKM